MSTFLSGLGGVVVGVLLALAFGIGDSGAPPPASTPRLDGLVLPVLVF